MTECEASKQLIRFFCFYLDCDFRELAQLVGVDETTLRRWEKKRLTRAKLARLARAAGLTIALVEAVVAPTLAALRLVGQGTEEKVFRNLEGALRQLTAAAEALGRAALADLFAWLGEQPAPAQEPAEVHWERLKTRTAAELLFLVDTQPELLSRDLVILLADASIDAAATDLARASAVAHAAHRLAVRLGREQGETGAAAGWALGFVGNYERVANNFDVAAGSFAQANRLWKAASDHDRAFFPGWRLLDLEASLLRDQGQPASALARLTEAETVAPSAASARILVNRALALIELERPEEALAVLAAAEAQAAERLDPRVQFCLQLNRGTCLVDLGRLEAAERQWPAVQAAVGFPGKAQEVTLMIWHRARLDAGLGNLVAAHEGFDQARQAYETRKLAAIYAVVSLERAVVDLKEGRYADVKELAEEIKWVFHSKGLHDEALAALRLFQTAAERETLTVDVAERMVRYMYRAQSDPKLKFEG
ncbi:MAG TPA: hypothetical protein DD490_18110 [Acidobacteria bacterium]|nr:hypothetical protein [Acidobacteriota bacterium]